MHNVGFNTCANLTTNGACYRLHSAGGGAIAGGYGGAMLIQRIDPASPQPTEQDRLNVLTWEMDIPKGEKREIQFGFSVEHPRDMAITGLGV